MTTEAANLKLRRVSSSEQYSWGGGGGYGYNLPQSETQLTGKGEGQKTVVTPSVRFYFLQVFKFSFQISRFIDSFE